MDIDPARQEEYVLAADAAVARRFETCDRGSIESFMGQHPNLQEAGAAKVDEADQAYLRSTIRPLFTVAADGPSAVDLFSGCGGLSLGFAEACRAAGRAVARLTGVDMFRPALEVYRSNLPSATALQRDVSSLFDGAAGKAMTKGERAIQRLIGQPTWLLAGPPCQGYSSLNNHTRGVDPRNELYGRVARAAEVLEPSWVLIENVGGARWDEASRTADVLARLGYDVDEGVVRLDRLGVAQRRKRHVVLASRTSVPDLAGAIAAFDHPSRDLRWAIGDLDRPMGARRPFDRASTPTPENRRRMAYLRRHRSADLPNDRRPDCHVNGDHSYKSMYGRLSWDLPAQTITTGFGSMGQGRYVHPNGRRTLTPHEAARLQGFPDWFQFGARTRSEWATLIGNAAPMMLSYALVASSLR